MPDALSTSLWPFFELAFVDGSGVRQWTDEHSIRLVITIGLLIVAVVGLGTVLLAIRKRMFARENDMTNARTLMDNLRAMRDSGEMSEDEYDAAKKALATRVGTAVKKEVSAEPRASYAPKLPRSAMPPPSAQTARPGYDLTGERLPRPEKDAPPQGKAGEP
jgi:hypothetical protein